MSACSKRMATTRLGDIEFRAAAKELLGPIEEVAKAENRLAVPFGQPIPTTPYVSASHQQKRDSRAARRALAVSERQERLNMQRLMHQRFTAATAAATAAAAAAPVAAPEGSGAGSSTAPAPQAAAAALSLAEQQLMDAMLRSAMLGGGGAGADRHSASSDE